MTDRPERVALPKTQPTSPRAGAARAPSARWERPLLWLFFEAALLCILWANVRGSDRPVEKPAAVAPVVISLTSPTNRAVINGVTELKGVADLVGGVVESVEVRLKHINSRKVWPWQTARWTSEASTTSGWQVSLPRLEEGQYEVECRGYAAGETNGTLSYHWFTIDRSAPRISFFPLHDQQTVRDFSEIGGEIDKAARVQFTICRVNESAEGNRYWNGSGWISNAPDTQLKLQAASTGGFWFPSAETMLPKPEQIEVGNYLLCASALDDAGNEGRAAITILIVGPSFTLKALSVP
jgi:hypothetical protein